MDEVDEQLNMTSQEQVVAYRYHYGGGWHVSVTTGFKCVDLRKWYVRFGDVEKASRTRYQALGPDLIPVYRQSARR